VNRRYGRRCHCAAVDVVYYSTSAGGGYYVFFCFFFGVSTPTQPKAMRRRRILCTLRGNSLSINTYLWISASLGTSICMVTKHKNKNILVSKIGLFTMWDR